MIAWISIKSQSGSQSGFSKKKNEWAAHFDEKRDFFDILFEE